ncbi:GIY-YIG nuclease family protein [Halocynthiibacter styelae]|uniref:GIY-YIG nuclease family protein n=1 Tax=Halocynthiibacter styelae TaxID=2761955 RepID=A0A8J7ID13_9RHOB|nr:GIY-YIG nuclease family protein [Paenihalocynthiibacter styelae]MBI1492042.1 GIY-YIG nuclease family protein [Paenihalocynthiibacter styelae]
MNDDLDALAGELAEFEVEDKPVKRSPVEERLIAGFEDIQRFVDDAGHPPHNGPDNDIFERLYAVRLERLAANTAYHDLLEPLDHQGLLKVLNASDDDDELDMDALASELEDLDGLTDDITNIRHVRPVAERKAAEDVASRERCQDFEKFKPMFEQVQSELTSGVRATRAFERKAEIEVGRLFVLKGQKAYVAEKGKVYVNDNGMTEARLRVIFDNGTESNLLMRSLQRALNEDKASRRITDPSAGPLFADASVDGDEASGVIYVLRSKSNLPVVAEKQDLLHKIGVTGGSVEKRIANAKLDPTFLMADVEIVTTYELFNINRVKLENLLHRIFEAARLDIEIKDRFGHPVTPREWFLVPLFAIDEAVERIRDGSIKGMAYDPKSASLR